MSCEPWSEHDTPDFLTVARHLRASGVHVPYVYGIAPAQGLMCLEDFGDTTLAAAWQTATTATRLQWGRRAVDELVQMHTVGTQRRDPACPAFHLAFDVPKLLSELQFFRQHAIEGLWHQSLTAAERQAFDAACMPLCALLAAQPRYFCHRDYHGWNIMAHAGSVGVLDFQDARLGPQPYDLVSLLVDRGTPEVLGQEGLTALTTYYIQRMEAVRRTASASADLCRTVGVRGGATLSEGDWHVRLHACRAWTPPVSAVHSADAHLHQATRVALRDTQGTHRPVTALYAALAGVRQSHCRGHYAEVVWNNLTISSCGNVGKGRVPLGV